MAVRAKRIYDEPVRGDGYRVLVDRLWPRGFRKDQAPIDRWAKELAPSTELRKWYGHDPEKFAEFKKRYRVELKEAKPAIDELLKEAGRRPITLVTATKDIDHSAAAVLAEHLGRRADKKEVR